MKLGSRSHGFQHHVECFAQLRSELAWFESAEKLPGFKSLSRDDKENTKKHIP